MSAPTIGTQARRAWKSSQNTMKSRSTPKNMGNSSVSSDMRGMMLGEMKVSPTQSHSNNMVQRFAPRKRLTDMRLKPPTNLPPRREAFLLSFLFMFGAPIPLLLGGGKGAIFW